MESDEELAMRLGEQMGEMLGYAIIALIVIAVIVYSQKKNKK